MPQDFSELRKQFSDCSKLIAAVGDETRQSIIMALMENPGEGLRVGAITRKTNLSRPAVSHHIGILRDADIITLSLLPGHDPAVDCRVIFAESA